MICTMGERNTLYPLGTASFQTQQRLALHSLPACKSEREPPCSTSSCPPGKSSGSNALRSMAMSDAGSTFPELATRRRLSLTN
eukprot:4434060-Amphidinium_carterae.2